MLFVKLYKRDPHTLNFDTDFSYYFSPITLLNPVIVMRNLQSAALHVNA